MLVATTNLLSGVHLSTIYLIVTIVLATFSLYIAIKKNREDNKTAVANAITEKVVADTQHDIAETVKSAVITEVKEAIANLDYKISRNGKNTDNLGDVAARTEDKVDSLQNTVNILAVSIGKTNDELIQHLGWHQGWVDYKKYKEKEKEKNK